MVAVAEGMVTRSFKVPSDVDELMRDRDDVNWSGLIRSFIHEYAASGHGTEAAMAIRLEQVENELDEAKGEVRRLEQERDRLREAIESKKNDRRAVFEAFADLDFNGQLEPSNPAVQKHAERLQMSPETFLQKYREWSG